MFFFATDLHGQRSRYASLLSAVASEVPEVVLLGGDLLPVLGAGEFVDAVLAVRLGELRRQLGERYPRIFLILGNDDARVYEPAFLRQEENGLWTVLNDRAETVGRHRIYGYPFVPPTPFALKDWERYDVSHFVDPGCISPEDGIRTVDVPANRRISLSLKALEQNPWDTIAERYPVGSVITGKVRNLTDFGAFVEVEEGIDGLIHISDMSWNRRLKHPNEVLKKGDTVQARVINVDGENQRLSLSIREFLPNEWDTFAKAHNVGDEIVGTVSKITDFGLFIRLDEGIEGLAHISELQRDARVKLDKAYQVGEQIRARIIKIDTNERKIGLTTRDVEPLSAEEQAAAPATPAPDAAPVDEVAPVDESPEGSNS
jgi:predicted RNA-binding protein with RPS1 domain